MVTARARLGIARAGFAMVIASSGAGCGIREDYVCTSNEQCNTGVDGVCEPNGRCSVASVDCASRRAYTEFSGELSGTCLPEVPVIPDSRDPLNLCAEGQPPALGETACTAAVCSKLSACCDTGWSSACVQQAQLVCPELRCDTRLAITATRTSTTELWTATFDGTAWSTPEQHSGTTLAWFAPTEGATEPRLGVFAGGTTPPTGLSTLAIGGTTYNLSDRTYTQAWSIDMNRDGHDHVVLGSVVTYGGGDPRNGQYFETFDLDTGVLHEFKRTNAIRLAVGDIDHDEFPDLGATNNTGRYEVLLNDFPTPQSTRREFVGAGGSSTSGDPTTGMPLETRSIEWSDVDGNGFLDLVVSGLSTRVHLATPRINPDVPSMTIDCDPLSTMVNQCTTAASSFVSTVRPVADGARLVLVPWPQRTIYEMSVPGGIQTVETVPQAPCSGMRCTLRWIAVASRDLDGDHVLDHIVIDEYLNVYTTRSSVGGTLTRTLQIPTAAETVTNIRLVVTGAPIP